MRKQQILKNGAMAIVQTLITGVSLFLLYRLLLDRIGAVKLGIWSLVVASASTGQIANLGLSASVVKFVATYAARDRHDSVSRLIQTTQITLGLVLGLLLAALYPFAGIVLKWLLPPVQQDDALAILPFALLSVWLMSQLGVINGGLDGYQRADLRNWLTIVGTLVFLVLAVPLAGRYGLIGLAYAQVLQYAVMMPISILILRRLIRLPWLPRIWDHALFKEMIGYGVNFQAATIARMLFDPTTKFLLTKFGGVYTVGFFEMASKAVIQLRGIIVTANEVMVPVFADITERAAGGTTKLYRESYNLVSLVALPLFTIVAISAPGFSRAWIGWYEPIFINSLVILAGGWLINTLTAPAYFAYLGGGRLRWNTLSAIVTGLLNLSFGLALGALFTATGVIAGWSAALAAGSLIPTIAYLSENRIEWSSLWPKENRWIGVACILTAAGAVVYFWGGRAATYPAWRGFLPAVVLSIIAVPIIWWHPMRGRLLIWWTERANSTPGSEMLVSADTGE